jgi:hypothetical protein
MWALGLVSVSGVNNFYVFLNHAQQKRLDLSASVRLSVSQWLIGVEI